MSPSFSPGVRARFPQLVEKFEEFEATTEEYEVRFQERFSPQRRPGGRMVLRDAARLIMLSAHARLRVLTWGVVTAVNADLGALLFLSARAHLETAGMMAYLLRQCRRFLAEEISAVDFQEQLDRLFLGRRTALEDDPQRGIPSNERAIQVLDLVDSVDYLVDGEARREVQGMFREAYEWLSEFCHPNLQARAGEHDINGSELVFLRTPRLEEGDIGMTLSHLRFSDFVVSASFQDCSKLLDRPWPEK